MSMFVMGPHNTALKGAQQKHNSSPIHIRGLQPERSSPPINILDYCVTDLKSAVAIIKVRKYATINWIQVDNAVLLAIFKELKEIGGGYLIITSDQDYVIFQYQGRVIGVCDKTSAHIIQAYYRVTNPRFRKWLRLRLKVNYLWHLLVQSFHK